MFQTIKNTIYKPNAKEQVKTIRNNQKKVYIFGGLGKMSLGSVNMGFLRNQGIDVEGFIANKAYIQTNTHLNKPVYAIEEAQIDKDSNIVVGISNWVDAKNELKKYGFENIFIFDGFVEQFLESIDMPFLKTYQQNFEKTYSLLGDELSKKTMIAYLQGKIFHNFEGLASTHVGGGAYFNNDLFQFDEKEIMIDCGAFDGDTALQFATICQNYSKIYALEPNSDIFQTMIQKTKDLKIVPLKCGAYSSHQFLSFSNLDSGCSKIQEGNTATIEVDAIDNIIKNEKLPITFIKMDIEGSELEAIKGAAHCIKKYKPKLAICVYHKKDDLFSIPEEILKIRPDYKLFLRNHQCVPEDTVLYAL